MSLQGDIFRFKLLAVWKPHLQVDHHFDSPAMLFYYYHPLVSHLDSCVSSAVTSTRKPKWILKSRNPSPEFLCITLSNGSLCLQPSWFSDKTFPCLAFFPKLPSSLLLSGFLSCRPMCARFPKLWKCSSPGVTCDTLAAPQREGPACLGPPVACDGDFLWRPPDHRSI